MFEVGAPDGWAVSGDADVGEGEGAAENGCVVPGWVVAYKQVDWLSRLVE